MDDLPVILARKDRDLFWNAFEKNPFQDSDPLCLVMDAQGNKKDLVEWISGKFPLDSSNIDIMRRFVCLVLAIFQTNLDLIGSPGG